MTWKDITSGSLTGLINVLNKTLSHFTKNLDESNLNLNTLEISSSTTEPIAKAGKIIIFVDSEGKINAKLPDNSIKTFATYTAP